MCIAILVKEGFEVPMEHLVEGARSNPDGCGMGWVENGVLNTYKAMEFADFIEHYNEVKERCGNIQMLIHFRITSKGATNIDMCHPFWVDDQHIIIHNGTITDIPIGYMTAGRSDTSAFAEEILAGLPSGWEDNESIMHLLEEYVGWSKIVMLDNENNVTFINEKKGFWVNNIWYSNKSYERYVHSSNVTYLPAIRSDNYQDFNSRNRVNNYKDDSDTLTGDNSDWCDTCHIRYSYNELFYDGSKCFCVVCVQLRTEKALTPTTLEDEADEILQEIKDNRTRELIEEIINCDCCEGEFFTSELYHVWIDAFVPELCGNKDICSNCFKVLYTADNVKAVEILY